MTVAKLIEALSAFDQNLLVAVPGTGSNEDDEVEPTQFSIERLWEDPQYPGIYQCDHGSTNSRQVEVLVVKG